MGGAEGMVFVFDLLRFVVSVRGFGFVVFYLPSSSLLICICFFFYSLPSLLHLVLGLLFLSSSLLLLWILFIMEIESIRLEFHREKS